MSPSQQFLKFAADCESMAKLTLDRRNEPDWHRLAEPWVRCAEWADRESPQQRKLTFEGANRSPNSDNPISTVMYYHRRPTGALGRTPLARRPLPLPASSLIIIRSNPGPRSAPHTSIVPGADGYDDLSGRVHKRTPRRSADCGRQCSAEVLPLAACLHCACCRGRFGLYKGSKRLIVRRALHTALGARDRG